MQHGDTASGLLSIEERKVEADVKLKDVVDRVGPWHVSENQALVLIDRLPLDQTCDAEVISTNHE